MYMSIAAAADWFYVIPPANDNPRSELVIWRLAAWALTTEGRVIGLVSLAGSNQEKTPNDLASVPPVAGEYKHGSQLTGDERKALPEGQGVRFEWLATGEGPMLTSDAEDARLDQDRLRVAIEAVDGGIEALGYEVTAEGRVKAIVLAYQRLLAVPKL